MNIHKLNYVFHRELMYGLSYNIKITMCSKEKDYEAISDNWEEVTCESCFEAAQQEIKERFKTSTNNRMVQGG